METADNQTVMNNIYSLEASAYACKNYRSLDYLTTLRDRIVKVKELKDSLTRAYEDLAEWLTEGPSQRTKFADVRELFRMQGLTDQDYFSALEKRFSLKKK